MSPYLRVFLQIAALALSATLLVWAGVFARALNRVVSPWAVRRAARALALRPTRRDLLAGTTAWEGELDGISIALRVQRRGVPIGAGLKPGDWGAVVRLSWPAKGPSWHRVHRDDPPADDALVFLPEPLLLATGPPRELALLLLPQVRALLERIGPDQRLFSADGALWLELLGEDVAGDITTLHQLARLWKDPPELAGPLRLIAEGSGPVPLRASAAILVSRCFPGIHAHLLVQPREPDREPTMRALVDWLGGRRTPTPDVDLAMLPRWAWRLLVEDLPATHAAAVLRPLLDQARAYADPDVRRVAWHRAVAGDPDHHRRLGGELAVIEEALAMELLTSPAGSTSTGLLTGALGHRSEAVRAEGIRGLTRFGDRRALDSLRLLLRRCQGEEAAAVQRCVAAIERREG